MMERVVRRLTESDAERAGGLLARAFVDEPVFVATLPDRSARIRLCPPVFTANVRHACRYGEAMAVGTPDEELLGVAYWAPRPEPELTADEVEELGYAALQREWGPVLERLGEFEAEAVRSLADIPEPWRYLGAIGVDPDHQGCGLGSLLLRRILADAAAAGVEVGLMTDRRENLSFYERAGFTLAAEGAIAGSSLSWWAFRTGGGEPGKRGGATKQWSYEPHAPARPFAEP